MSGKDVGLVFSRLGPLVNDIEAGLYMHQSSTIHKEVKRPHSRTSTRGG